MIPEHNARREHLDGIVALAQSLPKIEGVELLPYYDLWRAKLDRFGLKSELPESVKPPESERGRLEGLSPLARSAAGVIDAITLSPGRAETFACIQKLEFER